MRRSILSLALLLIAGPAQPGDAARGPAALQGQWVLIAETSGGVAVPAEKLKDRKLAVKGDAYIFKSPVTGGETGTFTVDPAQKPPTIDVTPADGPNKGKTRRGIYAVEGDTLKVCFNPIGAERPSAFASERGSKTVLLAFRREKP